ncbi:ATP-dependent endonuclease [Mucilaginibacter sp. L196]|uniref:ATP-dependent nuclease n=1 Tax=Mucilaginibacter sp. L196 TaxID=1641870 RepID=UPI00131CA8A4|nr:AAA family ATPase [Mucilaginibacter sp. L196]
MILKKVSIKNFRSIKELDVDFSNNSFRILVGKNESGKTNILKALSLLAPDIEPSDEDIREPLPEERSIVEAYVRYIFNLNQEEIQQVYKNISATIYLKNRDKKIITDGKSEYTLLEFCKLQYEGLYRINILDKSKAYSYWTLDSKFKLLNFIKKNKSYIKPNATENITVDNALFIDTEGVESIIAESYTTANISELHTLIGSEIKQIVKAKIPTLMYWQYDESNLLPATINIDEFAADPDTCIPLKNLFKIAGIKDITKEITNAQVGSKNKIRNLLDRVADHGTKHFRAVWKEYDYISFFLSPNGEEIDAGIKEKNNFSLNQRSDGFKRFVTFLLMLSVNDKNKDLSNTVIVIDEPDMGLHPSGVRSLRDELINISKNNYILASTHSIFLIDKENISRHYIVKKVEEVTQLEITQEDNIIEEEVLYKALGYSIYDQLKEKNILFEGWRDKKLFKTALKHLTKEKAELKDALNKIGISSATGVKSIKNITPIFELTNKKCIVISDNDKAAIEKQKEFKKERIYGVWKRYNEIYSNASIITGEDFLTSEHIGKVVNKLKIDNPLLLTNPVIESNVGILAEIQSWVKSNGIVDNQDISKILEQFKNLIFDTFKGTDTKNDYFLFLEQLKDSVNKL